MERLKNTIVLQKCNLFYNLQGKEYCLGTISKEFLPDRGFHAYVFDIDEAVYKKLHELDPINVNECFIPGLELDEYGFYQAFSKLPFFISMRVLDPRRPDLQPYLDKLNMQYYDAFTMFLRLQGRSVDNFHVEEVPVPPQPGDKIH